MENGLACYGFDKSSDLINPVLAVVSRKSKEKYKS
jgi:hypothetical protein